MIIGRVSMVFFIFVARNILLVTLPLTVFPPFSYEKGFTFNQYPFALLRVEEGKVLHAKGKGEGTMFPMTVQKTNQALGKYFLLSINKQT